MGGLDSIFEGRRDGWMVLNGLDWIGGEGGEGGEEKKKEWNKGGRMKVKLKGRKEK